MFAFPAGGRKTTGAARSGAGFAACLALVPAVVLAGTAHGVAREGMSYDYDEIRALGLQLLENPDFERLSREGEGDLPAGWYGACDRNSV